MNNIKVTAKATFNPGPTKMTTVRTTAKARVSTYSFGAPVLKVVAPRVISAKKTATFSPGAAKPAPVRTTAKAKVKTGVYTRAMATAKPRAYVTRTRARAHVIVVATPGTAAAKPHDRKTVIARCVHNPVVSAARHYLVTLKKLAHAVFVRPAASHDRKTASAKAVFGSFGGGAQHKFGWR